MTANDRPLRFKGLIGWLQRLLGRRFLKRSTSV